ncbi:molybdopterin dinucleotide binding domain-containing protein, partial [Amycolatopsis sp. SID8362]|uniref:molybdopterin dinucleotide binding domain-containing protein n=1 Tax=Amycolatopsis sp. SID8362 TaxID=2690346 RepID=UPI00142A295C
IWQVPGLPARPGRDTDGILAAAAAGELGALVVGGVDLDDLRDPRAARDGVRTAPFVVSLELRSSAVTGHADVVFPVTAVAGKAGTFADWENRHRPFEAAVREPGTQPDHRVLHAIAAELSVDLGLPDPDSARRELERFGPWSGDRAPWEPVLPGSAATPGRGQAVLATWRMLLDEGVLQEGESRLAATARPPVVRLSAATAEEIGAAGGDPVTVSTAAGAITLPLAVTDLPGRVVWLPTHSRGSRVYRTLGAGAGDVVHIGLSVARALRERLS